MNCLFAALILMRSPKIQKKMGTGIHATAMKPSSELPQPIPSASYMLGPASGSRAPMRERNTVAAALTDAA